MTLETKTAPKSPMRLSIAHLMLLTFSCSVPLAIVPLIYPAIGSGEGTLVHPQKFVILNLFSAALASLALAGALSVLYGFHRKQIETWQFGHALLWLIAASTLADLLITIGCDPDGTIGQPWQIWAAGVLNLAEALGWLLIGWTYQRRWAWCALCVAMVIINALLGTFWLEQSQDILPSALYSLLSQLIVRKNFPWLFVIPLGLTLLAWRLDRTQKHDGDWLHHAGINLLLAWLMARFVAYA